MQNETKGACPKVTLLVVVLLVFSWVIPAAGPEGASGFPVFATRSALAEDEPYDPDDYDLDTIPFRLVNVEGKEPGIDRESEWKLVFKPEWPDRDLPQHVKSVTMMLYCRDLDWKETLSHVWKKDLEGLPETLPCSGVKIGGTYEVTAEVKLDNGEQIFVSNGFTIDAPGREQIDSVIAQAVSECKVAGDDWQTALNMYRWLLNHMVYDYTLSYYSSDAILRGTGVCDSYARLYFLLCRQAGLSAYVIYGNTAMGYHAWDAVQINGQWYYADPTWDDDPVNDPAMDHSKPTEDENGIPYGVPEYKFFMLNKQLMTLNGHVTFEWLDDYKLSCAEQPANSLAAHYYVHTGRCDQWGIADGEGFRTIRDMIRDALAAGEKMWSSFSIRGKQISTRGFSDGPFYMISNEVMLMNWILKGSTLELPDGTTVKLDTYCYESPDGAGQVMNVYAEGARETDEPGKYELPKDLRRIEAGAFEGDPHCGEVICPVGLESIGPRAFAKCKRLWTIRIPSTVQTIAEDAFADCGEFSIFTEHRDSEAARYAERHGITLFVDDEEEGSNG